MPEGPEICMASRLINDFSKDHTFVGKVIKSAVSKNPDIVWDEDEYEVLSRSRGKELLLTLTASYKTKRQTGTLDILFKFGMSGKFEISNTNNVPKHAHLQFLTKDKMVLSFVDARRFGRWVPQNKWSDDRGPCILFEYEHFRKNVLENLTNSVFNKPICEVLLDQTFFNGIGNYLRAEVLFRAAVAPFVEARQVLEKLPVIHDKDNTKDILQLCNKVALEVIHLTGSSGYNSEAGETSYDAFNNWLQCYSNSSMKNLMDHNGRTIWFSGPPGPLVPSNTKSRKRKKSSRKKKPEMLDSENAKTKSFDIDCQPLNNKDPQIGGERSEQIRITTQKNLIENITTGSKLCHKNPVQKEETEGRRYSQRLVSKQSTKKQ